MFISAAVWLGSDVTLSAAQPRMARNGSRTITLDNRKNKSSMWTIPLVALVTFLIRRLSRDGDIEVRPGDRFWVGRVAWFTVGSRNSQFRTEK